MNLLNEVDWIDCGASNLYLCRDEDGLTLIDAGIPRRAELVFRRIAALGGQPSDLRRIVLTHADLDHAGSLAAIQARSGATVYAGAATAELITTGRSPQHMPVAVQFVVDHLFKYRPAPAGVIRIVREGDVLPVLGGLQAIATPGHTPDHFAFYSQATGVLFAGDALNTRDGRLQCTPPRITADEDAANRSALRLLELAPAIIACGHGAPLRDHASDELMHLSDALRKDIARQPEKR